MKYFFSLLENDKGRLEFWIWWFWLKYTPQHRLHSEFYDISLNSINTFTTMIRFICIQIYFYMYMTVILK